MNLLKFLILITVAIAPYCSAQLTNAVTPNGETTIIMLGEKYWSISDLQQIALNHLLDKGNMPRGLEFQTSVRIYPRDPVTMCEFVFVQQKFRQPAWHVKIGYDARVKDFRKIIRTEGHPLPPIPK